MCNLNLTITRQFKINNKPPMTQFIESFFDTYTSNFKLWSKKTDSTAIDDQEVIFQAPMFKIDKQKNKLKERYFVLTRDKFFYLKSEKTKKIRGVMDTRFVRVEYSQEEGGKHAVRFNIRFIKNMKYCDFILSDEKEFKEWKRQLSKVFIQSDFHTKFNAIKMIGKGSFARVYLVEDKDTMVKYAVKAFSKEYLLSQTKGKESLINEIEIMQHLKNEFVMSLEELHESKNSIYLVLELLEGGELFNYISGNKSLTNKDLYRVMKCLLSALAFLAENGIMHRDLKPENMILKNKDKLEDCVLKLVDFGLATRCDVEEYLFKRCGTPGYVAPEIINAPSNENIKYTPKCDVFSAGVILYIMIAGKSPFDGKSFQEILSQNKQCNINFGNPKLKKFPHALNLLQKMLEVNPLKRISAKEALKHEFFASLEKHSKKETPDDEVISNNLKEFQAKEKAQLKNADKDNLSLVVRDPVINGETNTVNDSNSDGGILSFKNMNKKPVANDKRASIFKYVMMKNGDVPNDLKNDSFQSKDSDS